MPKRHGERLADTTVQLMPRGHQQQRLMVATAVVRHWGNPLQVSQRGFGASD